MRFRLGDKITERLLGERLSSCTDLRHRLGRAECGLAVAGFLVGESRDKEGLPPAQKSDVSAGLNTFAKLMWMAGSNPDWEMPEAKKLSSRAERLNRKVRTDIKSDLTQAEKENVRKQIKKISDDFYKLEERMGIYCSVGAVEMAARKERAERKDSKPKRTRARGRQRA